MPNNPNSFDLDEYAARRLANEPTPPPEVLARPITARDVKRYPAYFILGPGHEIASTTDCGHGYHLTDTCPTCEAAEENDGPHG